MNRKKLRVSHASVLSFLYYIFWRVRVFVVL